jgi:DNA-binding MurR/RpiR family transcriptional regulator
MTMMHASDLKRKDAPDADRFRREIQNEIDNLRVLVESVDPSAVAALAAAMHQADAVYVVGSRFYLTAANYLGWAMTKIRPNVRILKGSDSTSLDYLTVAPKGSLVVMVAASRYPNEMIRLAKHVRRLGHTLAVVSDSPGCPLNAFAHHTLVGPARHIPAVGIPTTLPCLLSHLLMALAQLEGEGMKAHQKAIERTYRENDILFNLDVV